MNDSEKIKKLFLLCVGIIDYLDCGGPANWQRQDQIEELKKAASQVGSDLDTPDQE